MSNLSQLSSEPQVELNSSQPSALSQGSGSRRSALHSSSSSSFHIPATPQSRLPASRRRPPAATPPSAQRQNGGVRRGIAAEFARAQRDGAAAAGQEGEEEEGEEGAAAQAHADAVAADRAEIWGTTIDVEHVRHSIANFLNRFTLNDLPDVRASYPSSSSSSSSSSLSDAQGSLEDQQEERRREDEMFNTPFYPRLLSECVAMSSPCMDLDLTHLHAFDAVLHAQLLAYPADLLPMFDAEIEIKKQALVAADRQARRMQDGGDDQAPPPSAPSSSASASSSSTPLIIARPFHLPLSSVRNMRSLDPSDLDHLISMKGLIIRVSSLQPEMSSAYFQCSRCAHGELVPIVDNEVQQPQACPNPSCRTRHSAQLIHNRCLFLDKQIIKIQETPDSIPEGQTPHAVSVVVYSSLVDAAQPGDRVLITGIYRAQGQRLNPKQTALNTVYQTHVDGLHIQLLDHKTKGQEKEMAAATVSSSSAPASSSESSCDSMDPSKMSEAELQNAFRTLAEDPHIYERLVLSLAPSIWAMDDVKKGLLCQLFGGSSSEEGARQGKFRGELNILLCGDPGTSKSQLLSYCHQLAPRGIYTSGKGSSAVGLTASISKDPETRETVLESGALVLSDRGLCCIDEFDKMSDQTRAILHEVMEQQTVSIAKAGIVCTLNARTSILASANPKQSRYNPNLSVVENIDILPTLLSRFDLIYLILDQPNVAKDRLLARHLVKLYFDEPASAAASSPSAASPALQPLSAAMLTQYIAHARKLVRPVLSEEAKVLLIDTYQSLRRVGQLSVNKVVTATPRQLEALIRLSEAIAKMHLQTSVSARHVQEARRLMAVATASAATDPTTGRIDLDLLMTGHSSTDRQRDTFIRQAILLAIEALSSNSNEARSTLRVSRVLEHANQNSDLAITDEQIRRAINDLVAEGLIVFAGRGNDLVRKV